MAEALLATLLVALLSMGVAAAMSFAGRQYRASMLASESKLLASTLTNVVRGELSNTPRIRLADAAGTVDSFYSRGYAHEETEMSRFYAVRVDENLNVTPAGDEAFGQLLLGSLDGEGRLVGNLLLSGAAYGTWPLQARVCVRYDAAGQVFHVTLSVRDPDGNVYPNEFDVLPLNDVIVEGP